MLLPWLDSADIDNIQGDYSKGQDQLCEIFKQKLKQEEPLTWAALIEALKSKSVGENRLAQEIKLHFLTPQPPVASAQPEKPRISSFEHHNIPSSSSQSVDLKHQSWSVESSNCQSQRKESQSHRSQSQRRESPSHRSQKRKFPSRRSLSQTRESPSRMSQSREFPSHTSWRRGFSSCRSQKRESPVVERNHPITTFREGSLRIRQQ